MTRMGRMFADLIRTNPHDPRHPWSILPQPNDPGRMRNVTDAAFPSLILLQRMKAK
jgi:hypothetical protein